MASLTSTGAELRKPGFIARRISQIPADFGRTDPIVHYWVFVPAVILQLAWVARSAALGWAPAAGMFVAGAFVWTFLEYCLHRFSFHLKSEHPLTKPFNSGLHLLHHHDPASRRFVGAPIALAAPIYGLTLIALRLTTGDWIHALMLTSGVISGFLFYEFAHFNAHQRNPRTRYLKYLKKHHMRHHFGDEQMLFGVTSPIWDLVFGTLHKSKTDSVAVANACNRTRAPFVKSVIFWLHDRRH